MMYSVTYRRNKDTFTVAVQADCLQDSVQTIADKHPDVNIIQAATVGLFIPNSPSWVSQNGAIQRLASMSSPNLRGIRSKLLAGGDQVRETGLYKAICSELEARCES